MKTRTYLLLLLALPFFASAQTGIGTTTPGTTLDVNGGFTTRETTVSVIANAATIPANTSFVRITGSATSTIAVTAPAAPNAGQQLTVYNNSTGGFAATINGFSVPAGQAKQFIYSNSGWHSVSTPAVGSAIIPYSSGIPTAATTVAGGLVGTVSLVGFGTSTAGVAVLGTTINLTGAPGINLNFGFTMPRAGIIRSISATYSNVVGLALIGSTVTLRAQLYVNDGTNNTFTEIAGGGVNLSPGLTGIVNLGDISSGLLSGLSIPVQAGHRVMLVLSATASGLSLVNAVTGYISGGVSFD